MLSPTSTAATQPVARGFYYGWVNVVLAALAMVATLPGRTQGLGLITEPLLADLHIDRVTWATINLWATLIGSLFCIPCGRLVDRVGARITMSAILVSLAATVLVMSTVNGVALIAVSVILTRGFGQSALSVVSLALVGKWFGRGLNYAMAVYSLLIAAGFIAAFPSVGNAILTHGWRAAWSAVGWTLVAIIPLAWFFVRNTPEDAAREFDTPALDRAGQLDDFTASEALRSTSFWVFALSSSLFGLVYSGIALFNQSILEQRGFDASVYHSVLVISTMLGLAANFLGGWLASRWSIQRLMGLGMAALSCSLVALPLVRTHTHVMLYGAGMGISGGVVTVVFFTVWGQVFGRRDLGKIQGYAQMMTVFASAVGPLLLARTLETTGSYDSIFYGLAAVVAALGAAAWITPLPVRRQLLSET